MSYPPQAYGPPSPPAAGVVRTFDDVRTSANKVANYLQGLNTYNTNYFQALAANLNNASQGFGADIASASTIIISNFMHRITGTATISQINFPPQFNGQLALISVDGFSLASGGNIANSAAAPAGSLVMMVYLPPTGLWYVTSVSVPDASITTAKLAPGAASSTSTVTDNTSVPIGTSDTQVGTTSLTINATSDLIEFRGFIATTVSGYAAASSSITITAKLWRGTVISGSAIDTENSFLNSSTSATLAGEGAVPFVFYDTGVSGAQSYSVSLAVQTGPTITKTRTVIIVTDFKAQ